MDVQIDEAGDGAQAAGVDGAGALGEGAAGGDDGGDAAVGDVEVLGGRRCTRRAEDDAGAADDEAAGVAQGVSAVMRRAVW